MIAEFSGRSLQFLSGHEAAFPGMAGFAAAVADARKAVEAVPPDFSFTFFLDLNPQAMGGDRAIVFPRLLAETEGWVGFIVYSVAYRIGQFLYDLVTGINDARPYRSVGAARSLVELSAFVYHYRKIIIGASAEVSSILNSVSAEEVASQPPYYFVAIDKGIVTTLKAALHFAQVTRFNWSAMVRGNMDEFFTAWNIVEDRVVAKNISTLIQKLPGEEKGAAQFHYEMLCDFVHPNVGAHTLVVSRAAPMAGRQMRYELSREPNSDEALTMLVNVVAIPVRDAIGILLHDLEQLQRVQEYFGDWRRHCEALAKGDIAP